MRSDHLSKHSKIHMKKSKRSAESSNNDSSKVKTESPPAEEQRQIVNITDQNNLENVPKPTFPQELSVIGNDEPMNYENQVYSSQKSSLPLFYTNSSNQGATFSSHQPPLPYNNPNPMFYHFNNYADTNNRPVLGSQNVDYQSGTATSAYNEIYTYDNYHHHYPSPSGASQAQVYHINYGNGHGYY